MKVINKNINQIVKLCVNYQVDNLYVFGSILTDKFTKNSDIDFVVKFAEIDPLDYLDNYYGFKFGLEDLLGRRIDLLETQTIDNPIFKKVLDETKVLIYDRSSKELVI